MTNYPITVHHHSDGTWTFTPGDKVEVKDQGASTITFTKDNLDNSGTFEKIRIYSDQHKNTLVYDSKTDSPSGSPFSASKSNGDKTLTVTDTNNATTDTTYWYTLYVNLSSGGVDHKDPKIINKAPVGIG